MRFLCCTFVESTEISSARRKCFRNKRTVGSTGNAGRKQHKSWPTSSIERVSNVRPANEFNPASEVILNQFRQYCNVRNTQLVTANRSASANKRHGREILAPTCYADLVRSEGKRDFLKIKPLRAT